MLKTLLTNIEKLSNEQRSYEINSNDWYLLETQIVKSECLLFNELVKLTDLSEYNTVLPLLSLHLIKYIETDQFQEAINILTIDSKVMIYLILEHLQKILEGNINE